MNLETRAFKLGATEFGKSNRKNKKYFVVFNGKKIHFGHTAYHDYTEHKDPERRKRYLARAKKIKDKQGNLTWKNKNTSNFWAINLLWA